MDLNLEQRFNEQELNEIRKRVFSFADRMFLEGISVGRELNNEAIYDTTEQFVRDKLSAMTSYFIRDDLWVSMPPHGYNPNPNVNIPDPVDLVNYENTMNKADKMNEFVHNPKKSIDELKAQREQYEQQVENNPELNESQNNFEQNGENNEQS